MKVHKWISCAVTVVALVTILSFNTTARADVVRTPISTDQIAGLVESCLLDGGGDQGNSHNLPVFCCATNSEGTRWCVTCFSGTTRNPNECVVTTPTRRILRDLLRAPDSDVLAPEAPPTVPPSTGIFVPTEPLVVAPSN